MKIIKLPAERWEEYKNLRLRALKEDPQAFGANYEENKAYTPDEWMRRLRNAWEEKTNWLLFAEDGGELVGIVGAFIDKNDSDIATIYSVYVPKEKRGKGIAGQIMREMLFLLKRKGIFKKVKLAVNKDQIPAVKFYQAVNFHEVDRKDYVMGNRLKTVEIVMEKDL